MIKVGIVTIKYEDDGALAKANEAIKELLSDPELTHICLLDDHAVVPDGVIDELAGKGLDVCAPVINAANNEQRISVSWPLQADMNDFAARRKEVFGGSLYESVSVSFSAVVLKREVIESIGDIDEQFAPGTFESDDYCLRVRRAGYRIWIARDCYVHILTKNVVARLFEENKSRFEEKWSTQWKDPGSKMLESVLQDIKYLEENKISSQWAQGLLYQSIKDFERRYESLVDDITEQREKNKYLETRLRDEISFSENILQIKRKIGRRLARSKGVDRGDDNLKTVRTETQRLISPARKNGMKTAAVFATMFTPENINDGYVRRVKEIDEDVLGDYLRIYLQLEEPEAAPALRTIDEKHICLWLDPKDREQAKLLSRIVLQSDVVYIHSVLRLMKSFIPDRLRDELFTGKNQKIIWDVHGSVPEEFEMQSDFYKAEIAGEAEAFLAGRADLVVMVSNALRKHLEEKYRGRLTADAAVIPNLYTESQEPIDCSKEKLLSDGQPPLAVYAGGLQKWQKIGEMQDVISAAGDACRYAVFCSRQEEFINKWGVRPRPAEMRVESKAPEEMAEEYKRCHYGFSLRDDVTVNNVACPTKLIEYIQYGIAPVLDSPKIGDFFEMGLEYISSRVFTAGDLPAESERLKMAEKNYGILKKLTEASLEGKQSVLRSMSNNISPDMSEKKNIALVVGSFDKGGLEQVVLNLYLGYKNKGWNAYILSQHDVIGPMAEKLHDPKDIFVFNSDADVFKHFCHKKNIDVLHYHYNTFMLEEAAKAGFKILYTMHNVYTWMDDQEIKEYSKILSSAHKVIPVSGFVESYYLGRTGAPAGNVQTILNGVDFKGLDERHEDLPVTRNTLGFDKNDIIVAELASFHPAKHQIGMIGVMERLYKKRPEIKLLLVGNEGDPEYYAAFTELLENSPAKENIKVVPYFDHKYVGQFLRDEIDIFALPSLQEGCSNAVLEAIYCAKPMLLTEVGNASDVKGSASCEVIHPAYEDILSLTPEKRKEISLKKENTNTKELADALAKMADDLDKYKTRADEAAKHSEQYSAGHMAEQYTELIRRI